MADDDIDDYYPSTKPFLPMAWRHERRYLLGRALQGALMPLRRRGPQGNPGRARWVFFLLN